MSVDHFNANADYHVPDGFTKYGSNPIVKAPHLNGYVLFYGVDDEVRYLVGTAQQVCHRDTGHNVECNFMPRPWREYGNNILLCISIS